ncbi:MAG TPA: ERF family protein [Candidatus Limnocylindrales bacterium]|nr:ERF family protein [Candidatus Limnocylindrales bacterium]
MATAPAAQLAPAPTRSGPSVGEMLGAVIEKGVTQENVAAIEKLVGLYERMEEKAAERQFNAAFVALQADLPVIVASTVIPNRGKYERYEDVMRVVAPLLVKHGFTVSFTMGFREGRVLETCHLRHVGGHSQSNSFAVRTGRADSETQADCKAATTAKRNALLNALNIVIRQDAYQDEDGDASLDGAFIAPDKALYLRELVRETKADEAKFLRYAGADKYEEIPASRYDVLVAELHRRKRS